MPDALNDQHPDRTFRSPRSHGENIYRGTWHTHPVPEKPLSRAVAAKLLRVAPTVIDNALASGVLPNLNPYTVTSIARREVITGLTMRDQPVPVLRSKPAVNTPNDPERPFHGFSMGNNPDDVLTGIDRWWPAPGRDLILAAGGYLVTSGSIVVAVVMVHDRTVEDLDYDPETRRYRYHASLVGDLHPNPVTDLGLGGRFDPVDSPRISTMLRPEPEDLGERLSSWSELARMVLGKRVLGGAGGTISTI